MSFPQQIEEIFAWAATSWHRLTSVFLIREVELELSIHGFAFYRRTKFVGFADEAAEVMGEERRWAGNGVSNGREMASGTVFPVGACHKLLEPLGIV